MVTISREALTNAAVRRRKFGTKTSICTTVQQVGARFPLGHATSGDSASPHNARAAHRLLEARHAVRNNAAKRLPVWKKKAG